MIILLFGGDGQRSSAVGFLHGIFGIGDEVQKHLLHLSRVDEYPRKVRVKMPDDFDNGSAQDIPPGDITECCG